ncbi:hypothetical protein Tco_0490330 [Tanacetum coccineum]
MKELKLQFSSGSAEASGFESMFSIPSSTINLLKVGSSRGLYVGTTSSSSYISASAEDIATDCYFLALQHTSQNLNILDTTDQDWEYLLDLKDKVSRRLNVEGLCFSGALGKILIASSLATRAKIDHFDHCDHFDQFNHFGQMKLQFQEQLVQDIRRAL